jgi:hypothetical protein
MNNKYDLSNVYTKIYYESSDEFEAVRDVCLQDSNWLSYNYTKENLVIEDHNGYAVAYAKDSNEPIIMAGVYNNGRYPNNVARMVNRLYTFPKFRTNIRNMVLGFKLAHEFIINPLIKTNTFDMYFITMQNRPKYSKGWWNVWKNAMQDSSNNYWTEADGYIQTHNHNVQKCWQNFIYKDIVPGTFQMWNPKIIMHDEWLALPEGA